MRLSLGDRFERYTVEALVGEGGMGAVYRVHDPKLGRRVALKVIASSPSSQAGPEADLRLIREARAAAAIDHPNAVAIFDVGEHEGVPFIVMELVEGTTLRAHVGDPSGSIAARTRQLTDVARAISGAHKKGVVHRDIKPENVMVRSDGMVKVLDFGIARRSSKVDPEAPTERPALATLTLEGVKMGTPVYMAPEQIRGEAIDERTDQFAWGVVAYELLTGRLPWRGADDALAVMASVLTDEVDRAPLDAAAVPKVLASVLLKALSKRPDERFATMEELLRALDAPEPPSVSPSAHQGLRTSSSLTAAQRFSTVEVREVLGRALREQAERDESPKLGFEDLLAVAAEVGVDAESLRKATRALRASAEIGEGTSGTSGAAFSTGVARVARDPMSKGAAAAGWVRRQRRDFYRHAGIYAIINAGLLVLGLVLLAFTPWWVWFIPALAWGVGVAIHGLVALTAEEDDWREEQEQLRGWRLQRQRRHEERIAALNAIRDRRDGSSRTASPREERRRVVAPVDVKLRVAAGDAEGPTDGGVEQAEEEALAASCAPGSAHGRARR